MATAGASTPGPIVALGKVAVSAVTLLGDFSIFSLQTLGWMIRRRPAPGTLLPSFYLVGVRSRHVHRHGDGRADVQPVQQNGHGDPARLDD
jgi:hypothetical protein